MSAIILTMKFEVTGVYKAVTTVASDDLSFLKDLVLDALRNYGPTTQFHTDNEELSKYAQLMVIDLKLYLIGNALLDEKNGVDSISVEMKRALRREVENLVTEYDQLSKNEKRPPD